MGKASPKLLPRPVWLSEWLPLLIFLRCLIPPPPDRMLWHGLSWGEFHRAVISLSYCDNFTWCWKDRVLSKSTQLLQIWCAVYLVTQLCLTLRDPKDCSLPRSSVLGDSPGKNYWRGLPCPSPGDLPHAGIEPWSPTLQADSLPSEPPGKATNMMTLPKYFRRDFTSLEEGNTISSFLSPYEF